MTDIQEVPDELEISFLDISSETLPYCKLINLMFF